MKDSFESDNKSVTAVIYRDGFALLIYLDSFMKLAGEKYGVNSVIPEEKNYRLKTLAGDYIYTSSVNTQIIEGTNSKAKARIIADSLTEYVTDYDELIKVKKLS